MDRVEVDIALERWLFEFWFCSRSGHLSYPTKYLRVPTKRVVPKQQQSLLFL